MSHTTSHLAPVTAPTSKRWEGPAFAELCELWQGISYGEVAVDYAQLFQESPVLGLLTDGSPNMTYILDMRTLQFAFISSNAEAFTGYSRKHFLHHGLAFFGQITHPADLVPSYQEMMLNWQILLALPPAQLKELMFSTSYRLLKPDNTVLHLLQQNSVLQLDHKGNIVHLLGICTDITSPEDQLAHHAYLEAGTDASFFSPDTSPKPKSLLTKRELDIVKLMATGHSSKAIAEKLCLSFHTVNTHRRSIIKKTKAKNAGGVIQYVLSKGLI